MVIERVQQALKRNNLDGWLFFDHHHRDPLAYKILGLPDSAAGTRRWYYFIPASGEPRKLVHQIESGSLDSLPGEKLSYARWSDQQSMLKRILSGARQIAMQYSPNCVIPYVSLVDAGTIELVRGTGVTVSSSADLVQEFEARWTERQFEQHVAAGNKVDEVRREAFRFIGERLGGGNPVNEYEVQQFIRQQFEKAQLFTDHGPIVGVNENASNPHYEPTADRNSPIRERDLVLIDLWAKLREPDAVYYDVTWTGFCGSSAPSEIQNVFTVVRDARKKASEFVVEQVAESHDIAGYQVDDEARGVVESRGFGQFFFHRTGHSIGTEVHGTGANMDNLESHDERRIISHTCFSIEPGVYLPKFGIRSEVNVYVGEQHAQVTGEEQETLVEIRA
ncbi:MAG TPA: M24 family metallopeptidase [Bryobacteraceae bacterium]|jgi:Xaa-Pro aminopeptidase|nr:M24 family metallopeptidase [Bryobacteraceae bacterium]